MPILTATNIHKTYRLGKVPVPVLHGVDLSVDPGQFVAILGASGSGKSTLLHILGGLDRPTPASLAPQPNNQTPPVDPANPPGVTIDNTPLASMNQSQLDRFRARTVGFVFQFYHLLPELTVLQNVLIGAMIRHRALAFLGQRDDAKSHATSLLSTLGLSHRLNHRPRELSGGERQRVAIARALINQPPLLLADEPTGNLDHTTGDAVLTALLDLRAAQGLTLVMVTHDPRIADRADRVIRLEDGRVLAQPSAANP